MFDPITTLVFSAIACLLGFLGAWAWQRKALDEALALVQNQRTKAAKVSAQAKGLERLEREASGQLRAERGKLAVVETDLTQARALLEARQGNANSSRRRVAEATLRNRELEQQVRRLESELRDAYDDARARGPSRPSNPSVCQSPQPMRVARLSAVFGAVGPRA